MVVWGCFGVGNRDFLTLFCGIGECKGVSQVAGVHVLPVVQLINETIGDAVLQWGDDPVHTASAVTRWLERCNIQVDEHPPYSPDLNPIERVWVVLKQQLHK